MKQQPELEDLFAAARRAEANKQRQQQLSELIDQLAAKESMPPLRRQRIWAVAGIAACFLLLIGIGRYALSEHGTNGGQKLIAVNKTETIRLTPDNPPTRHTSSDTQHTTVPTHPRILTAQEPTIPDETDNFQPLEQPDVLDEETTLPTIYSEPERETLVAKNHEEPKVYVRTSTRLVCGSGCKPETTKSSNTDTPQIAQINPSSTGTEFELSSIPFERR